jgi:succinate--hydroxymethylglutarate CoA-transferase
MQVLEHRKDRIHFASYLANHAQFRRSHASAHANGPLLGIRILDLTRVLAVSLQY